MVTEGAGQLNISPGSRSLCIKNTNKGHEAY